MLAVVTMLAFYSAAAVVIFSVVPRSLRQSKPEIPSTVPRSGWTSTGTASDRLTG